MESRFRCIGSCRERRRALRLESPNAAPTFISELDSAEFSSVAKTEAWRHRLLTVHSNFRSWLQYHELAIGAVLNATVINYSANKQYPDALKVLEDQNFATASGNFQRQICSSAHHILHIDFDYVGAVPKAKNLPPLLSPGRRNFPHKSFRYNEEINCIHLRFNSS